MRIDKVYQSLGGEYFERTKVIVTRMKSKSKVIISRMSGSLIVVFDQII